MGTETLCLEKYGFKKLESSDSEEIYQYLSACEGSLSSWINAPSLIGWGDFSIPYYRIVEGALCLVIYESADDVWLCAPPLCGYRQGFPDAAMQVLKAFFGDIQRSFRMEYVKEWMLPYFEARPEYDFEQHCDEAYSDYIYSREDFEDYLDKPDIRYAIRHCQRKIDPAIEWLTEDNAQEFQDLLKSVWCPYHSCEECVYGCLHKTLENMLASAEETGLSIFLVKTADGKNVAYCGYTMVGDDVVVLVKKVTRSIKGLTDYIHKVIVDDLPENVRRINYTEDMGSEGMRAYKRNLAPHVLSHNYVLKFRRYEHG